MHKTQYHDINSMTASLLFVSSLFFPSMHTCTYLIPLTSCNTSYYLPLSTNTFFVAIIVFSSASTRREMQRLHKLSWP